MKILFTPNPILTVKSKRVQKVDKKILKLVSDMEKTLSAQTDPEGVGLAAPQVGVGLRLFIIKKSKKAATKAFINPEIINVQRNMKNVGQDKKKDEHAKLEGCLSIPRLWGHVDHRAKRVELTYTNLSGKTKTEWFGGFEALIIQHEVDHLNGILFTKRVLEENGQLYKEIKGELREYSI